MLSTKVIMHLLIFVLILRTTQTNATESIDPDIQAVLMNPQFLLFRRGENEKIFQYDLQTLMQSKNRNRGVGLNPFDHFENEAAVSREITRNVLRGYLNFLYSDQYLVNEPDTYIETENIRKIVPVLQFEDGEKNHYLLKRFNDSSFDLILLEYSPIFKQYSGKKMDSYDLMEYLHTAQVAGVDLLRIAIYEEKSFKVPRITNLEIPIKNKSLSKILAEKMAREEAKLKKESAPVRSLRPILTTERKAQMIMKPLEDKLKQAEDQRKAAFEKRKELILMRLPYLKKTLDKTRNENEITLAVQSEIIESIFEPYPTEDNCPGKFEKNQCTPTVMWTNKVWRLYRQLYRFKDVASHIFPDRRAPHRQELSKSKEFGGAELW